MENQKLTQEELQQLTDIQQKRDNLMFELSQIYGDGSLNLETGEFVPTPQATQPAQ